MDLRIILGLLFVATIAHSYCNPVADVCSAAGISCPSSSSYSCKISGSTIDFNYFDVFCAGHLYLPDGYIKGRAAMGHDFNPEENSYKTAINIGQGLTSSDKLDMKYSFVSASDVSWNVGQLYPTSARALNSGRTYAYPPALNGRVDHCPSGSSCVNDCFHSAETYWRSVSSLFGSQSASATTSVSGGVLSISCSSSKSAYFITISGSTFNQVTSYSIGSNCNSKAIFVFNINGGSDFSLSGTPLSATGTIYNVRSGPTVHIKGNVYGSIINIEGSTQQTAGILSGWLISSDCRNLQKIERPICHGSSTGSSATASASATSGSAASSASAASSTGTKPPSSSSASAASSTGTKPPSSSSASAASSTGTKPPSSSSTGTGTGSTTCTEGQARCVTSETYQGCNHGVWAATQSCQTGLTCHPSGNVIYCY